MADAKHTECMDDGTWVCDYCHNLWDKEYHPDFCDEYCPDYMESGKFCGTEAQWAKAINEGKCAFTLGSSPDANPYKKARLKFPIGFRDTSDNRLGALRDLECQWDSGYATAKRRG